MGRPRPPAASAALTHPRSPSRLLSSIAGGRTSHGWHSAHWLNDEALVFTSPTGRPTDPKAVRNEFIKVVRSVPHRGIVDAEPPAPPGGKPDRRRRHADRTGRRPVGSSRPSNVAEALPAPHQGHSVRWTGARKSAHRNYLVRFMTLQRSMARADHRMTACAVTEDVCPAPLR